MAPERRLIRALDVVGAWVKESFFDPFEVDFDAKLDRVVVVGSEAFAPGTFTLGMKPRTGGDATTVTGEFFDVFRQVGEGAWKYTYAIFNFDQPIG